MIPRVWSNGVASMPLSTEGTPMLAYSDAATLDGHIQRALDKSYRGGNLWGTTLLGPGASLTLASTGVAFNVNANCETSAGGRLQCGHGDYPTFSSGNAPLLTTIQRQFTFSEMFSNLYGNLGLVPWPAVTGNLNWVWYNNVPEASIYSGTDTTLFTNGAAIIPLTRVHDLSNLSLVTVSFLVNSGRNNLPTRFPGANLFQYDPFLNVLTSISGGWNYFNNTGGLPGYKNGGGSNSIVIHPNALAGGVAIDVSKYAYFLAVLDEDYGADSGLFVPNFFTGFGTAVEVSDLHFQ